MHQSAFMGIEIGKRGIDAHSQGLMTIGHNIINASTEGYSRQRVNLSAFDPLYAPDLTRAERPGQIGQGVEVVSIERAHDTLLEARIAEQTNFKGYWEQRDKYILMAEQIYNEPGEYSVRNAMDKFWEAWQELSLNPSELPARQAVVKRGESLIDGINGRYASMKSLRDMIEGDIAGTVREINRYLYSISDLNREIVKVKAIGDDPNDLLDKRDLLVRKLSEMINITVDDRDPDEFQIHTSGSHLIQGKTVTPLSAEPDLTNEGYSKVVWQRDGKSADVKGGRLGALIELRDDDIRSEIQKLDLMTVNFIDQVNQIHRKAWTKNNETGVDFFREYPFVTSVEGNYDRNGDGVFDSTYIFRVTGTNKVNGEELAGIGGIITLSGHDGDVEIPYYPTDTVKDILSRINNSSSEVNAVINSEGKITLRASASARRDDPDFVIRHIEDSGEFLAGYAGILKASGREGSFSWETAGAAAAFAEGERGSAEYAVAPLSHPAGWIKVNEAVVADPMNVAAGFGENGRSADPSDGSAASAVASLRNQPLMIGKFRSFDEYFSSTVADIGLKGEEAVTAFETQSLIVKELDDMKQSVSGVNLDEELAQMIKFQHGYAAAARFIAEQDKMFDIIINRMG